MDTVDVVSSTRREVMLMISFTVKSLAASIDMVNEQ